MLSDRVAILIRCTSVTTRRCHLSWSGYETFSTSVQVYPRLSDRLNMFELQSSILATTTSQQTSAVHRQSSLNALPKLVDCCGMAAISNLNVQVRAACNGKPVCRRIHPSVRVLWDSRGRHVCRAWSELIASADVIGDPATLPIAAAAAYSALNYLEQLYLNYGSPNAGAPCYTTDLVAPRVQPF